MTAVTLDRELRAWKPLLRERRFNIESSAVGVLLAAGIVGAHWWTGALGAGTYAAAAYALYAAYATNIDLRVHRLPDVFTVTSAAAALVFVVASGVMTSDLSAMWTALMCAGITFAFWYALALIVNVGFGDVKFIVAGSLLLGYNGWGVWAMGSFVWMIVLMIGQIIAALIAGKDKNDSIPQGPIFALSTILGLAFPLMFAS